MKFLDSTKIDKKRWDELVGSSSKNNVFCYSWYLDATTEKWGAILENDYKFGMPLPYKNRIIYKKAFQHPYSRNIDFFGDKKLLKNAEDSIQQFRSFSFHFNHQLKFNSTIKKYQELNLKEEIVYKKNALRILEKNKNHFHYKFSKNIEPVLNLYFANSFNKIKQQSKNKKFLSQLIQNAIENQKGETLEVYNTSNELVASAFFILDKETVYYLIGDASIENKKNGVIFSLMDHAIKHYMNDFSIFDFGGSNIESVATFYKKMGGKDVEYYQYSKH